MPIRVLGVVPTVDITHKYHFISLPVYLLRSMRYILPFIYFIVPFIIIISIDTDFGRQAFITVDAPGKRGCIDFTLLVVDDTVALEGNETFIITIENTSAMAMVNIIDDDGNLSYKLEFVN